MYKIDNDKINMPNIKRNKRKHNWTNYRRVWKKRDWNRLLCTRELPIDLRLLLQNSWKQNWTNHRKEFPKKQAKADPMHQKKL